MANSASHIDIDGGGKIRALAFSANGAYLVSGDDEGVQVWRVEDKKKMAAMKAENVRSVAVSKDGRFIAAGTFRNGVFVWDANTYKPVCRFGDDDFIKGVDFSPDSTRLVTATHTRGTVSIWNVQTGQRAVGPLRHWYSVRAAKFSPQGDRIATATERSVRVYDSHEDRVLVDIPVKVTPLNNHGLLWSNDHLFIVSDDKIKKIDASTGSAVSDWPVSGINDLSCITLLNHGEFIACSTNSTITFCHTSRQVQLDVIQHAQDIRSIALSPDDHFLAFGGGDGKITIKNLWSIFNAPDIHVDDAALYLWKNDKLTEAEALLTAAISSPHSHDILAGRALVRTRLQRWDAALDDANQSIEVEPSTLGYIAKSIALVGKRKRLQAYRACDIAFQHLCSTDVNFLLLIKAVVVFMAGEHDDAISRLNDLIATVPLNSICYAIQAHMYFLLGNLHMERNDYTTAIPLFERARTQVRRHESRSLLLFSLISGWKFDDLDVTIRQRLCEALCAAGRTNKGGESLVEMVDTFGKEVYTSEPRTKWVSNFTHRYLSGDVASSANQHDEATTDSPILTRILREWVNSTLASGSWMDALSASAGFMISRFTIYQTICERLEMIDHIMDAIACVNEMQSELARETEDVRAKWILDFKYRCCGRLEGFGDTAMHSGQYDQTISQYSAVLSLNPTTPHILYCKRGKAYEAKGLWEDALNDANEVIALNPSSPFGYERKYVASRGAGHHQDALDAFEMMLLKMSQSHDPNIRGRYLQYTKTKEIIRTAIQNAIRESPRVLINTTSGRLCNKSEQIAAFELQPIFTELISSMATHIDHARIEEEVAEYYRYAMFSHKWEENEPLFEKVVRIVVYDLEKSPTHDKLQMFCKIVRGAGFHWAWSDTCCINKADHFVLQEALVAMFKWYQGSALTIIHLCGVRSPSRRGDLVKSIWNSRAWTFQEYHASKVVRFYNENWTLYMNLDIHNHKESPEIVSEMEEVTGVSAQALMALRPGLDNIREKLCLAARRETTLVEDVAYSLLGMFSVSLPVVYGEGDKALGKLLAQLLTGSGDTSILAWTGRSGSFNSCLPAEIAVFGQLPISHIPSVAENSQMDTITSTFRASSFTSTLSLAMKLYDRLDELPVPFFIGMRMKLPCIIFKLGSLASYRTSSGYVFRAQTAALGIVEITTKEDLSRLSSLCLIHPWLDFLLDRQPVGGIIWETSEENADGSSSCPSESPLSPITSNIISASPQTRAAWFMTRFGRPFGGRPNSPTGDGGSLRPPSSVTQQERQMQALRLVARLRQPFGALLLTPTRQNVAEYRRVAAESLITVQIEEITSTTLNKLVKSVCVLDVL